MKIELLSYVPLNVADIAICKCYGNKPHTEEEKIQGRINRVANVSKHSSTIEHLSYTFDIDGISRACLQELARHRIASYTVKSTRYTLQELKVESSFLSQEQPKDDYFTYFMGSLCVFDIAIASKYLVLTGDREVDISSMFALYRLWANLKKDIPNDKAKYSIPESYKTSLVMTINARSLQNFLNLRTDSHALWEIQILAKQMYKILPDNHKFLYKSIIKEEEKIC